MNALLLALVLAVAVLAVLVIYRVEDVAAFRAFLAREPVPSAVCRNFVIRLAISFGICAMAGGAWRIGVAQALAIFVLLATFDVALFAWSVTGAYRRAAGGR